MSRRPRWAAVATALALLGAYGAVQSQSAQAASSAQQSDAAGDANTRVSGNSTTPVANEPRADVVSATADYQANAVVLSVRTAAPINPRGDAAWGESVVSWFLDTTGDKKFDYQVEYGVDSGNLYADVYGATGETPICTGAPSIGGDGSYVVTLQLSCLKSPSGFYWGGRMEFGPSAGNIQDRFPDGDGNYFGPIQKPGGTPAPTTPTTAKPGKPGAPVPAPTTTTTAPAPLVASPLTSTNEGFWLIGQDGGVFTFGKAQFFGSTGNISLNKPIVGMAAEPDGSGYWFVAADGGIFAYKAPFWGSTGSLRLSRPIVGMASTPTGKGYWLVASDGGIFAFGDAKFFGSTGNLNLNQPIVGMAATQSGNGYWFVSGDGGVFGFGDAQFFGSAADGNPKPVVGIAAAKNGMGYRVVRSDGSVTAYGSAGIGGGFTSGSLRAPIVAIVAS